MLQFALNSGLLILPEIVAGRDQYEKEREREKLSIQASLSFPPFRAGEETLGSGHFGKHSSLEEGLLPCPWLWKLFLGGSNFLFCTNDHIMHLFVNSVLATVQHHCGANLLN